MLKEKRQRWVSKMKMLLFRASGGGLHFLVSLLKALNAAFRIKELLLAGEKGMAFGTDVHIDRLLCRRGLKDVSAGANDVNVIIFGVSVLFHRKNLDSKKRSSIAKKTFSWQG